MAGTPDRAAFDLVSAPIGPGSTEFQSVARRIGNTDTLDAFLRDLNERYGAEMSKAPQARNVAPGTPAAALRSRSRGWAIPASKSFHGAAHQCDSLC